MVTVLLVDDMSELRGVLRQHLQLHSGFRVVAEAGDGATAVEAARRHQPDVVVLDLGLPDLAGHEVLTHVRAVAPRAQIVVYTGSVARDSFALTRDVDAYVDKTQDVSYLVELLVDLTARGRQAATLDLGPSAADVALARRFLDAHCRRWGCHDLLEDAELVVSELVTNAFLHAGTRCVISISFVARRLRIEVRDGRLGFPDVQAADDSREHGRGLVLVSAMADAWGVEPQADGGKIVWAELRLHVQAPGCAPDDTGRLRRAPDPANSSTGPPARRRRPGPGVCAALSAVDRHRPCRAGRSVDGGDRSPRWQRVPSTRLPRRPWSRSTPRWTGVP